MSKRPWVLAIAIASWLYAAGALEAQMTSIVRPTQAPQAKSEEELDAYLDIVTAAEPRRVIQFVDAFTRQFSQSELLSTTYQAQLHAYEQLDDFEGMLLAGRRCLTGTPDNIDVLLSLSSAIANRAAKRPDRDQLISEARDYAQRALAGVNRVRLPLKFSLDRWRLEKQRIQSKAHGVLGMVALQKGEMSQALNELATALDLAPTPEGVQFLRLGLAQESIGKTQDAEENLRRAAELGPDPVRELASGELGKLKHSAPLSR